MLAYCTDNVVLIRPDNQKIAGALDAQARYSRVRVGVRSRKTQGPAASVMFLERRCSLGHSFSFPEVEIASPV